MLASRILLYIILVDPELLFFYIVLVIRGVPVRDSTVVV